MGQRRTQAHGATSCPLRGKLPAQARPARVPLPGRQAAPVRPAAALHRHGQRRARPEPPRRSARCEGGEGSSSPKSTPRT
eukprot:2559511-Prymnesium_polylepis.1